MPRIDKDDLKRRLPLPQLMAALGHGDRAKRSAFCPFHENTRTPAFSIWQNERGWRWKCHAGCGESLGKSLDEISYLRLLFNETFKSALRRFADLSGGLPADDAPRISKRQQSAFIAARKQVKWPPDMHAGSDADLRAVANLRAVSFDALEMMRALGLLKFGRVCGVPAWIVLDHSNKCGEARRMDGLPFDEIKTPQKSWEQRKAHTLAGSIKSWPLGARLPHKLDETFDRVLLVEGSGDFVAAHHFALKLPHRERRWLPVAMLGASPSFIPEAIDALRGKLVRIVPHQDENKAGQDAEKRWRQALIDAGLRGSTFSLQGLRQHDGRPVKDLNDCVNIHADDKDQLGGLFQ